jgi:RNA recognition motif-containing protein
VSRKYCKQTQIFTEPLILFLRNEILKEKFSAFGEVGDVYIPRMHGSTDPRGYAFVRFIERSHAEDALRAMNDTDLEGSMIRVQEAKARRPENPRAHFARNDRGPRGG